MTGSLLAFDGWTKEMFKRPYVTTGYIWPFFMVLNRHPANDSKLIILINQMDGWQILIVINLAQRLNY
jgi:hypothetical protein